MYTLSDCVSRINQALNYPSVHYEDLKLYFDQAIAELNTSLHINIRPVSELITMPKLDVYRPNNTVFFVEHPSGSTVNIPILADADADGVEYYYSSDTKDYVIVKNNVKVNVDNMYGFIDNTVYKAYKQTPEMIVWILNPADNILNFDLNTVLPSDWISLFVIPYICMKHVIKEGDTGAAFAEDMTQGFQQLQFAYDIPGTVNLAQVAGKEAYIKDLQDNLPTVNMSIRTRAIYDTMKHDRGVAIQISSFYDTGGGW